MRNLWLVIKHEILCTLGKRSYWVTTLLLPLLILGITFGSQLVSQKLVEEETEELLPGIFEESDAKEQHIGYVDQAAVLQNIPPALPPSLLIPFSDEASAQQALAAGEIGEYYLIAEDFLPTGEVTLVQENFSPFTQLGQDTLLSYLIAYNLVDNPTTTPLILAPLRQSESRALAPAEVLAEYDSGGLVSGDNELWAYIVPYAVLIIFFFVITMSSSFMLHSVTAEKENRIVEVLLLSLRPRELMLGKILGLGVVALLQITIW
ncbi:MAG: ABC transporter permease, partial [Chloroflexota bacterium]|nr:ABC transporter permease [Chloroflexota bacterium]